MPRIRSRKNGAAKWKTTSTMPMATQPPCIRCRYHMISSGRLPDQMIRYCENDM